MASPKDLIDKVINFYDDVDASDADNGTRRARLLVFLQHVYSFVYNYMPWEWTYRSVDYVVVTGDNKTGLFNDFLELSHNGSVFEGANEWTDVGRAAIERIRRQSNGMASDKVFAIWNRAFQIPYTVSSDLTLTVFHRVIAETLVDNTDEMLIPARYADTVLLPALVFRAMESKNDARETWGAQFREGLSQMVSLEYPEKTTRRKMPLANRGW
jgi:hypothetical protein